jgi:hypothetical protein
MSNLERQALRGQLEVIRRNLRDEKIRADGSVSLLRWEIMAAKKLEEYDADKIENYSVQLVASLRKIDDLAADCDRLDSELNG